METKEFVEEHRRKAETAVTLEEVKEALKPDFNNGWEERSDILLARRKELDPKAVEYVINKLGNCWPREAHEACRKWKAAVEKDARDARLHPGVRSVVHKIEEIKAQKAARKAERQKRAEKAGPPKPSKMQENARAIYDALTK